MKVRSELIVVLTFVLPVLSQQTTYTTDLNGRRVPATQTVESKTGNSTSRAEVMQSVNGNMVPLQSEEQKVLREDANGRVVEKIIRRYDATGNPGPPEKVQVEERKNPDGSLSTTTTVYRADLNGHVQLAERVVVEGSKSGNTLSANTVVERPGLNGNLDVVERKKAVTVDTGNGTKEEVVTYRKDQNGRFDEALKQVTDTVVANGQSTSSTAQYELGADTGKLQLASQTVTHVRKNPDGTETKEVDIFRNVPGRVNEPDSSPKLTERQIVTQSKAGNKVVETLAVQRPTVSEPNRLSEPKVIQEKVCTGSCKQ
jgi:hypothetical protein